MNTIVTKSVLGQVPTSSTASSRPATSAKTLSTLLLAAGVAALVVMADQMIDDWAETHVIASWLALWAVAVLAIGVLRGVTRMFAQKLMAGLDGWSASVARRRSDQRLWAMAQNDSRMMRDLQTAMDRADDDSAPAKDINVLVSRRVARMLQSRLYYI
ncbi:MAG: hypothetical protein ACOYB1_04245 [Limnohabitans sp.]